MSAQFLKQQSLLHSQVVFAELTASYKNILKLGLNLPPGYSWQQNLSSRQSWVWPNGLCIYLVPWTYLKLVQMCQRTRRSVLAREHFHKCFAVARVKHIFILRMYKLDPNTVSSKSFKILQKILSTFTKFQFSNLQFLLR